MENFTEGADDSVVRRLEAVIDFLVIRKEWIVRSSPPLNAMSVLRPLATSCQWNIHDTPNYHPRGRGRAARQHAAGGRPRGSRVFGD